MTEENTEEEDSANISPTVDNPLNALADAVRQGPADQVPVGPWTAGESLSYELSKPRRLTPKERVQRIATAAFATGIAATIIVVAALLVVAVRLPEELFQALLASEFLAMIATLYLASVASRDGGDARMILGARALAFLWMPLLLGVGIYQGASVISMICTGVALFAVAGFFLVMAVVVREVFSAIF